MFDPPTDRNPICGHASCNLINHCASPWMSEVSARVAASRAERSAETEYYVWTPKPVTRPPGELRVYVARLSRITLTPRGRAMVAPSGYPLSPTARQGYGFPRALLAGTNVVDPMWGSELWPFQGPIYKK